MFNLYWQGVFSGHIENVPSGTMNQHWAPLIKDGCLSEERLEQLPRH